MSVIAAMFAPRRPTGAQSLGCAQQPGVARNEWVEPEKQIAIDELTTVFMRICPQFLVETLS
jgi:hypothetical protein